jgi:hypothetical protein
LPLPALDPDLTLSWIYRLPQVLGTNQDMCISVTKRSTCNKSHSEGSISMPYTKSS